MFELEDNFFIKLQNAIEKGIINAHKQDKIDNYKEIYISKIGAYGYMAIDLLDKDNTLDDKTKKLRSENIKQYLELEYNKLRTLENSDCILLTLQEMEYQSRKNIDYIKNGVD